MSNDKSTLDGLVQELRRGTLVLGVLSQLGEPLYGYSLVERLTAEGMDIDRNTLYPLLRRLEKQGLLESEWNVEESRPRRYYKLSGEGVRVLKDLTVEWNRMNGVIGKLIGGVI